MAKNVFVNDKCLVHIFQYTNPQCGFHTALPCVALHCLQAIDDDSNQTGQMLAALLNWPQATFASQVRGFKTREIFDSRTLMRASAALQWRTARGRCHALEWGPCPALHCTALHCTALQNGEAIPQWFHANGLCVRSKKELALSLPSSLLCRFLCHPLFSFLLHNIFSPIFCPSPLHSPHLVLRSIPNSGSQLSAA